MIEKNKVDSAGHRTGYWEDYFSDGETLSLRGYYVNGLRDGYWESFWWGEHKHWTGNFDRGALIGVYEYYENDVMIERRYNL